MIMSSAKILGFLCAIVFSVDVMAASKPNVLIACFFGFSVVITLPEPSTDWR